MVIKQALRNISVTWFLFYRFFLATVVTLVLALIYGITKRDAGRFEIHPFTVRGWFLGVFLFGSYFFQTLGLDYTSPSNAAFITSLSVILVPLVLVIKGKRLKTLNILSFSLATLGLAFITIQFSTFHLNPGDMIILGTAICLAIQIVFTDQYVKQYSALDLIIGQLLCTTILSLLTALIFEFKDFSMIQVLPSSVIFALVLTGVLATVYAYLVQTYSQKTVNPILIAIIFTFEPIFALILSLWMGEENLSLLRAIGMALILVATVIAIIQENKTRSTLVSRSI